MLTACLGAMSHDCTEVFSITTITGGNGRTCDLTRCALNLPSGCQGGDGASGMGAAALWELEVAVTTQTGRGLRLSVLST